MNTRAISAIIRKDLKVIRQNKGVVVPIIIMSLVFFVVMPGLSALVPGVVNGVGGDLFDLSDIEKLMDKMPPGLQQELSGLNMSQKVTKYFLVYMMAPMLMLLPILVASTIAADSFAGEKERKTIEALLYTPTTDRELFVAKLLSAWLTAIVLTLAGFGLYIVVGNIAAWPQMQRIFFPNAMWLALIIWVVPAVIGLGISVMVLASARAQGVQDATQVGAIVALPIIGLFYMQVTGAMYLNIFVMFLLGLVTWLLTGVLIWLGSRSFQRKRILASR
jgi:ABC-2 type transport system permease protein